MLIELIKPAFRRIPKLTFFKDFRKYLLKKEFVNQFKKCLALLEGFLPKRFLLREVFKKSYKQGGVFVALVVLFLLLLVVFPVILQTIRLSYNKVLLSLSEYMDEVYQTERAYLEKLPIYSDYITSKKEKLLRTHLLADHLQVAYSSGIEAVENDKMIPRLERDGKLIAVGYKGDSELAKFCFFYNVPQKYRYLMPESREILIELGKRFQDLLKERGVHHQVKFAVSSALRPQEYQSKLIGRNINAVQTSSHSYGTSFDVFFDEFFVALKSKDSIKKDPNPYKALKAKLQWRLGFLLGSSLRRQFRAILTEAILQLQQEGKLYAILERKQKCYHITFLPSSHKTKPSL